MEAVKLIEFVNLSYYACSCFLAAIIPRFKKKLAYLRSDYSIIRNFTINQVIMDYHWIDYDMKQAEIFKSVHPFTITSIIHSFKKLAVCYTCFTIP